MKVYFYSFSKRKKSTKQVNGSGLEKDVCWKEKTSIIKPSLITSFNPVGYNYVYIPSFSRYYFVSDVHTDTAGTFQIDLTEDELASHKATIGSTSASILYAAGSTKDVVDSRIPVKSIVQIATNSELFGQAKDPLVPKSGMILLANGYEVVIGVTGAGSFGPVWMYNYKEVNELLDGLDSWNLNWNSVLDLGKQLMFGGTAAECLRAAVGIPFDINPEKFSAGATEPIVLGNYPCKTQGGVDIEGYPITDPVVGFTQNITIPWIYTDWRATAGYCSVQLYIPLIGTLTLPVADLHGELSVNVEFSLNITSGDIAVIVRATGGKIVAEASGNCAIPVAYGSTGVNTNRMTQGLGTGIGAASAAGVALGAGAITAPAALAIGGSVAMAAGQTISALGGTGNGSPGLGGGAATGLDRYLRIWVMQKELSETQANYNNIMGKPYMGVATVGSFSGFVQTDGFQLAGGNVYDEERTNINQMLDTGIYYE